MNNAVNKVNLKRASLRINALEKLVYDIKKLPEDAGLNSYGTICLLLTELQEIGKEMGLPEANIWENCERIRASCGQIVGIEFELNDHDLIGFAGHGLSGLIFYFREQADG